MSDFVFCNLNFPVINGMNIPFSSSFQDFGCGSFSCLLATCLSVSCFECELLYGHLSSRLEENSHDTQQDRQWLYLQSARLGLICLWHASIASMGMYVDENFGAKWRLYVARASSISNEEMFWHANSNTRKTSTGSILWECHLQFFSQNTVLTFDMNMEWQQK